MKLNGVIYFYCPKESDLKNRDILRKHLCRPTEGRVFLQIDEDNQWTIPFNSTTKLISILNEIRIAENFSDVDYSQQEQAAMQNENARTIDDRRCLRISIADVDAAIDPMCHAHYLGQEGLDKQKASKFCNDSTGVFILLDTKEDYKYRKIYFTDMINAGIILDYIFSKEVAKRIPVNETINIPYDIED